jgi:hypothetical protein
MGMVVKLNKKMNKFELIKKFVKLTDKNGYPTRAVLKLIRNWDIFKDGTLGLIKLIKEIWMFGDAGYFVFKRKGKKFKLELHTAGWSGNEDIIEALGKNYIFWSVYWYKSEKGGHYYFEGELYEGENGR